ncbi:unnamed protein product, partial [Brachionus calyciflorus]
MLIFFKEKFKLYLIKVVPNNTDFSSIKKFFFILLVIFISFNYYLPRKIDANFSLKNKSENEEIDENCMAAYDIDMEKIFRSNKTLLNHPQCPENWVIIDSKGKVIFKEKFNIINCSYSTILWTDDYGYSLDYFTNITNGSYLDTNKEFFHIKCFSEKEKFYHVFSRIFKKEEKNPTSDKINVLVFLMDSLSREDWFENVPKSMEYLVKKLGAKVFKRYNTIGDATAEALTALFTSKKVNELPSVINGDRNAKFVDEVFPFIWKDFKNVLGYKTMFSEDMAFIGTFQM